MLSHSLAVSAFYGFLFALPALASPAYSLLDKRAPMVCSADNCLRALRATTRNPATASAFCTNYVTYAPGTVTTTLSTTTATTPARATITISEVSTSTVGPTDSTTTITPMETVTLNRRVQKRKRAVATPLPNYLTPGCNPTGTTSASKRVSSACSCFLTTGTATSISVSTVTAPVLAPTTVFTSTTTEYIYTSTVTSTAPTATVSTCVSDFFVNYQQIDSGPYIGVGGSVPAPGISSKIDCCTACFLGQNCLKFQFNPLSASNPAGADACFLFELTETPNPAGGKQPTSQCPRGYAQFSQTRPGGDQVDPEVENTQEYGPCIDESQK